MAKITDPTFVKVLDTLTKAGKDGLTLGELSEKTGIPYRAVHNITWRLEGSPKDGRVKTEEQKIKRVSRGPVRYAVILPGQPRTTFLRDPKTVEAGHHTYATTPVTAPKPTA